MAESTNPLSVQTTMPDYPDVTYETWRSRYGGNYKSRVGSALHAWSQGHPNYETWRQNLLDKYNAGISAYNAWASSPEGNREQREAAGYNVNYDPGTTSAGSPLSYQDSNPGNGFSEMAQGSNGVLSLADALVNFKFKMADLVLNAAFKKAQIENLQTKTQGTAVDNLWKNPFWRNKVLGLQISNKWNPLMNEGRVNSLRIANQWAPLLNGRKYDMLGYQADRLELDNSLELASRFGEGGSYVSGSGSAYNLNNVKRGLGYQKAYQDIQLVKATRELQKNQAQVAHFNAKEKEFYVTSIQGIYKEFLETQLGLARGELSFQQIDQQLKQKAFKWGVGLGVANTTLNGVKTVLGLVNPVARIFNGIGGSGYSPLPMPSVRYE